jgi:hypothetical protein
MRTKIKLLCALSFVFLLSNCKKEENILPRINNNLAQEKNNVQLLGANQSMYYWANLLVLNCDGQNTKYMLGVETVNWTGQNGATAYKCTTDCSGLVNRLFRQTYSYTSSSFNTWLGISDPLAKTYHDAIAAQNKFTRRTNINQIVQGDYIAIKYPEAESNTGHIMMVVSAPVLRTPTSPIIYWPYSFTATRQYEVTVIDCSNSGHGSTDERNQSPTYSGVGKGIFRIYTDQNGVIAGHTWSTYSNSEYYSQYDRHIEVGKYIP